MWGMASMCCSYNYHWNTYTNDRWLCWQFAEIKKVLTFWRVIVEASIMDLANFHKKLSKNFKWSIIVSNSLGFGMYFSMLTPSADFSCRCFINTHRAAVILQRFISPFTELFLLLLLFVKSESLKRQNPIHTQKMNEPGKSGNRVRAEKNCAPHHSDEVYILLCNI